MAKRKKDDKKLLEYKGPSEQRMGIPRGYADWILREIRRHQGETIRQMGVRIAGATDGLGVHPQALPPPGVVRIGGYTADFKTLCNWTFDTDITGEMIALSGAVRLTLTAGGSSDYSQLAHDYVGNVLPPTAEDGDWSVETKLIGQCDDSPSTDAGLLVTSGTLPDSSPDFRVEFKSGLVPFPIHKVYLYAGNANVGDLEIGMYSSSLVLKLVYEKGGGANKLKAYYNKDGGGDTLFATYSGDPGWTTPVAAAPYVRHGHANAYADFDYFTISYMPEDVENEFAFISRVSFAGYEKDHLYIVKPNGQLEDIDPSDSIINDAKLTPYIFGIPHEWDGSAWVEKFIPPALHPLSDPNYHTKIVGAVEKDLLQADAHGLPEKAVTPGTDVSRALRPTAAGGSEFRDIGHGEVVDVTADQHHNEIHTHVSHTGIGTDDHHAQSHAHSTHTGIGTDDHHDEAHTIASHSDTTATGAELETLTDGSNADALHKHAGVAGTHSDWDEYRLWFLEVA